LLADPCNAPLVRGVGPCSDGAILVRLEQDHIMFTGATETGGIMYWVPGAYRGFSVPITGSDTAAVTLADNSGNCVPGFNFLSSYSGMRCLAACVQATYPGAELNRSGICSMGIVPAQTLGGALPVAYGGTAGLTSVKDVRSLSQYVARTPSGTAEIKFRPGPADDEFVDLPGIAQNTTHFPVVSRGKNAFVLTASGLPAGVGLRVRCVAVYAVEPKTGLGLVASVQTNNSQSTVSQVLQYLDSKDADWWLETAATVLSVGSLVASAFGVP